MSSRARWMGVLLLVVAGPWLVRELERPSGREAEQLGTEIEAVFRIRAAGHFRDADHLGLDFVRKWERYLDLDGPVTTTHEQIERVHDGVEGRPPPGESVWAAERQSVVELLGDPHARRPRARRIALPIAIVVVGCVMLAASLRSARVQKRGQG